MATPRILLIDNYDSFTWNVYQQMAALGAEIEVHRNDALTADAALAMRPTAVVRGGEVGPRHASVGSPGRSTSRPRRRPTWE